MARWADVLAAEPEEEHRRQEDRHVLDGQDAAADGEGEQERREPEDQRHLAPARSGEDLLEQRHGGQIRNLGVLYQDYMSGSIEDLERAKQFYNQFISKAGGNERFSEAVESVRRRCRQQNQGRGRGRRRRRSTDCRPGRMQNIDTALEALRAAAEMQRQMEQRNQGGGG